MIKVITFEKSHAERERKKEKALATELSEFDREEGKNVREKRIRTCHFSNKKRL